MKLIMQRVATERTGRVSQLIKEYQDRQERACREKEAEPIQLDKGESGKLYALDDAAAVLPENVRQAAGISPPAFSPVSQNRPLKMEVDTSIEQKGNSTARNHESYDDQLTNLNHSKPNDTHLVPPARLQMARERPFRIEARDLILRNFGQS